MYISDMKTIKAAGYDIEIGPLNIHKGNHSKVVVIVDDNTEKHCLPVFAKAFDGNYSTIKIPSGEQNKTLNTVQYIWEEMMNVGCDRHSICYNLGGGVIGDMGGFSASTYMRGMDFVQIPTTLLSMVDASVGGKLGINFKSLKNNIGLIKNPNAVLIDPAFLGTLPHRELLSGYAEVIKHALIKDVQKAKSLPTSLDGIDFEQMIYESVMIKKIITDDDPYERGYRKVLNFGHTIGHAIESHLLYGDSRLLHGEAIAIGMVMEAHISMQKGYLTLEEVDFVKFLIIKIFGHQKNIPDSVEIFNLAKKDKKNKDGKIKCTLLEEIGCGIIDQDITMAEIEKSLNYYLK